MAKKKTLINTPKSTKSLHSLNKFSVLKPDFVCSYNKHGYIATAAERLLSFIPGLSKTSFALLSVWRKLLAFSWKLWAGLRSNDNVEMKTLWRTPYSHFQITRWTLFHGEHSVHTQLFMRKTHLSKPYKRTKMLEQSRVKWQNILACRTLY